MSEANQDDKKRPSSKDNKDTLSKVSDSKVNTSTHKVSSQPKVDTSEESAKTKSSAPSKNLEKVDDKRASLFGRLSNATSTAFRIAKKTTDKSYKVGKAFIESQDQFKKMSSAGESLRDLREVAGLTLNELNEALKLKEKDRSLLEAVENGTAVLSFDLILRLSALLARNDPIPFVLKYSRTYAPETWRILNDWGAGRLPLQYQREREFINILRSQDNARKLSDEGFNKVLEYTRHAFDLSLHFVETQEQTVDALSQELVEQKAKTAGQIAINQALQTETEHLKIEKDRLKAEAALLKQQLAALLPPEPLENASDNSTLEDRSPPKDQK